MKRETDKMWDQWQKRAFHLMECGFDDYVSMYHPDLHAAHKEYGTD
jgi:hypothetical protein